MNEIAKTILSENVLREVFAKKRGKITFAEFMDIALYDRHIGYYRKPLTAGKHGDFMTSVSASPLFGRILANQFLEFANEFTNKFEIIELGGQCGQLRTDVLSAAPKLNYRVVEIDDALPDSIQGCIFSNEFFDALPVHRLRARNGVWREIYVSWDNGLVEVEDGLSDSKLGDYIRDLPASVMDGYEIEVNLRAIEWMRTLAQRLKRGYIITIDYGFTREELFSPSRPRGTLKCFYRHTMNTNPFQNIGEQDITTHINFSDLIEEGERNGLETVSFMDQGRYLLKTGHNLIREIAERDAGTLSKDRSAIHQLTHPGLMGKVFNVLIQRKV